MHPSIRPVLFVLFSFLSGGAAAQSYWDEIELIDGQVLRGVVIDTVKDTKVIQLTTRDFISLPASSVVRTVTAQERRRQAEAKLALPPVTVDLSLAVVTSKSPGWKPSWGTVRYQTSQSLGIELEDGQVFQANWLDTTRGQAALLLADGRILLIDRSSIRRVTAVTAAAPTLAAVPAAPAEPEAPAPDVLTPLLSGVSQTLEAAFSGPPGNDPAPFRTFFVPTARLAAPGRLQIHQLDGAATQVTLGLSDSLQVQASSVLPTLPAVDWPSFWQVGAQVALPLPPFSQEVSAWLALGQWAGGLRTDKAWSDPSFLPFLNATVRTEALGTFGLEARCWQGTWSPPGLRAAKLSSAPRRGSIQPPAWRSWPRSFRVGLSRTSRIPGPRGLLESGFGTATQPSTWGSKGSASPFGRTDGSPTGGGAVTRKRPERIPS